ncbi:hypothetical protein E2C01_000096 [Portunus trituberculatus]|uniref:Uncharacterized protein n=1 Tax=Portunus trituberculatus TaxID=210409 RepID=A0A5B7CFF0_PORTR|nr:hypothetical protein [Portunus trituberculatus]
MLMAGGNPELGEGRESGCPSVLCGGYTLEAFCEAAARPKLCHIGFDGTCRRVAVIVVVAASCCCCCSLSAVGISSRLMPRLPLTPWLPQVNCSLFDDLVPSVATFPPLLAPSIASGLLYLHRCFTKFKFHRLKAVTNSLLNGNKRFWFKFSSV